VEDRKEKIRGLLFKSIHEGKGKTDGKKERGKEGKKERRKEGRKERKKKRKKEEKKETKKKRKKERKKRPAPRGIGVSDGRQRPHRHTARQHGSQDWVCMRLEEKTAGGEGGLVQTGARQRCQRNKSAGASSQLHLVARKREKHQEDRSRKR
jgi:hypothetical protein